MIFICCQELHKCSKKGAMPTQSEVVNLESVMGMLEVQSMALSSNLVFKFDIALPQDIARYINASKGDYDAMRQIEEVEQSLVDYKGPALLQCGRYHLDGELRIKSTDQSGAAKK